MSDQASSDIFPVPQQREVEEHKKHDTEEYRQAFITHLQGLLSLAGAKEIIKEEEDIFVILLIMAAVYGFHLWTISRSLEPEYNRYISNCFKPNLICVVFLLIVIDALGFPFKWVIICSITVATTAVSIIQTHPTFSDRMKEILGERWKRVQNGFKLSFNFRGGENGGSGNSTNSTADNLA